MHGHGSGQPECAFHRMWEEHCGYVTRLLARLSGDPDLAEDLLQETYIRASQGFPSYRGDGDRTWLTAIARNTFLAHLRRKSSRAEESLGSEIMDSRPLQVGSEEYLALLSLRHALPGLSEPFQTALIMRHYGGFSYEEIAAHTGCPVGTAKRRVWTAMRRLRTAIGEEIAEMKCEELRGTRLLDYLYGALSAEEAARVESHIEGCSGCRREAKEFGNVSKVLDAAMRLQQRYGAAPKATDQSAEVHATFARLTDRIAMIMQSAKSVFLRFDAATDELAATGPAWGFTEDELSQLRVGAREGVMGEVWVTREPKTIGIEQPADDALGQLGIRHGICVPVLSLGVLCAFEKRGGEAFSKEDVELLHRLARDCGGLIGKALAISDAAHRESQLEEMIEDFLKASAAYPAAGQPARKPPRRG